MRKYYLHHLAAGHSDKRYKLWMTPSILSSQVCKSPKASNCTFLPSVRTACKPFQSCFTTKLLFCFEYPKPDHSLTTARKSLHLIALKGRGSSDKVPNRRLSTLFKECFLMWRGLFLEAKWRQTVRSFLSLPGFRLPNAHMGISCHTCIWREAPRRQLFPRSDCRDETQLGLRQLQYWKKWKVEHQNQVWAFPLKAL